METKARRGDGEYGRLYEGAEGRNSAGRDEKRECIDQMMMMFITIRERERRWVLLKIPRCDIDGVGEGK